MTSPCVHAAAGIFFCSCPFFSCVSSLVFFFLFSPFSLLSFLSAFPLWSLFLFFLSFSLVLSFLRFLFCPFSFFLSFLCRLPVYCFYHARCIRTFCFHYVRMYIYVRTYVCIYIYVYVRTYIYGRMYVYIRMHVRMHVSMTYVCIYVCMYACIYVCMHVCIWMFCVAYFCCSVSCFHCVRTYTRMHMRMHTRMHARMHMDVLCCIYLFAQAWCRHHQRAKRCSAMGVFPPKKKMDGRTCNRGAISPSPLAMSPSSLPHPLPAGDLLRTRIFFFVYVCVRVICISVLHVLFFLFFWR